MWPFAPRPAKEAPRAAAWAAPSAATVPAARAGASPAAPAGDPARKRPVGFTLLSLLLAVVTPAQAVMLMMSDRPPGLPGVAVGLLGVCVLASAAVLSVGLWRCERWVGKVVVAHAALLSVDALVDPIHAISHVRTPAFLFLAGMGLLFKVLFTVIPMVLAVWYVRGCTRELWPTP